jgi:hypothetical protein
LRDLHQIQKQAKIGRNFLILATYPGSARDSLSSVPEDGLVWLPHKLIYPHLQHAQHGCETCYDHNHLLVIWYLGEYQHYETRNPSLQIYT